MAYPRYRASRAHKFANYTTPNLTTTSTTYVDTGLPDLVLAAQVGDTIEYGVNLVISSSGGSNLAALDVVTVAAGAAANATPVSYFAGTATDGSWRTQNPTANNMLLLMGSVMYAVVAGDITTTTGTVTLRTRWKTNTGTLTITADTTRRAHVWAKNLGPVDPN